MLIGILTPDHKGRSAEFLGGRITPITGRVRRVYRHDRRHKSLGWAHQTESNCTLHTYRLWEIAATWHKEHPLQRSSHWLLHDRAIAIVLQDFCVTRIAIFVN